MDRTCDWFSTGKFKTMSSADDGRDPAAERRQAARSLSMTAATAAVLSEDSCVFSSPVSNLAFNLEVLSTDGYSSQGSLSTDE